MLCLFSRVFVLLPIDFVPCVGILIARGNQKALNIDKSLHSNLFLHNYRLDLIHPGRIRNASFLRSIGLEKSVNTVPALDLRSCKNSRSFYNLDTSRFSK